MTKKDDANKDDVMEYDDLVRFINRSSYRVNVLKDLSDGDVKMPRDIAIDCHILPNHISNVLADLKENGLVICLNEDAHKGRLYKNTELSIEIINYLDSMDE